MSTVQKVGPICRSGLGYRGRQGVGFPDWEIVRGADRLWQHYDEGSVVELAFYDDEGRDVRLAVTVRDRRVFRSGFAPDESAVNLYSIPGLVRHFYGANVYGATEWYVANGWQGL